jgi:hypothetical protein
MASDVPGPVEAIAPGASRSTFCWNCTLDDKPVPCDDNRRCYAFDLEEFPGQMF